MRLVNALTALYSIPPLFQPQVHQKVGRVSDLLTVPILSSVLI